MEDIDFIIDSAKEGMDKAMRHLDKQFLRIRAGKASPTMLSTVMVESYGAMSPLSQVANISTPDARTLTIQPWDKSLMTEIEKAIVYANLGFNPMNNGENIIISVPPLTEERRKELSKQAKAEAEDAKVGIRNSRKEANNEIKKLEDASEDMKKDAEATIQKLTDTYITKIDSEYSSKEKEIMKV